MPVSTSGYGHVPLTGTDIARSRDVSDGVFGSPVAAEQDRLELIAGA